MNAESSAAVPGVWGLALATLRDAPRQTRRIFMMMTGNWLLVVLLQLIVDTDSATQTYEILELMSLMLGATGSMLLMLVHVLNRSAQESAGASTGGLVFTRMLAALPVFGAAAGMMLASAVVLYIARSLILGPGGDASIMLTLAVIFAFVAAISVRLIRESVLFLYSYATQQTAAATRATEQAALAELRALQSQMNPHFLFNALNTVASLVRTDPRAAERTVENLGDVLRMTLHRSETIESTVLDEIDYLRAYLEVEQERFGERLRVTWNVAGDTLDLPLPPLMLQPLVENSIRHGFGARAGGGTIIVSSRLTSSALVLSVCDDGEGFDLTRPEGTGIGNLRRRLAALFGDRARLDIESRDDGACVRLHLPSAAP